MKIYPFEIHLRSDAEPGSGLGSEQKNSLLPRNEHGKVCIPATHLKGLMRENLYNYLFPFRQDVKEICDFLFGRSGESDDGQSSIIRMTGAVADKETVISVTRTRIEKNGKAANGSLRTSEALANGSILSGSMECDSDDIQIRKLALFALLSLSSIGGSKTRGSGFCKVIVPGEADLTPGKLLLDVIQAEVNTDQEKICYIEGAANAGTTFKAVKLKFTTNSPVCLPERPHGKNNVISSGFTIAGTAVSGTVLNLLSKKDPELSSACFRSPIFRCYPLLPLLDEEDCLLPVQISNSHKMSKTPIEADSTYIFGDQMIPDEYLEEDYRWQQKSAGISMKGTNGVLIIRKDKQVALLKNSDIPRYYTAHAVINGSGEKKDNLFTMESVCVKNFAGLVILPEKAADKLLEILKEGKSVHFGKGKSTMGGGILTAEEWTTFYSMEEQFPQVAKLKNRLFIVQSPIVYEGSPKSSTRQIINSVLADANWGEVESESVMTSVLFGWNKLKLEKQIGDTGRVQAKRVILPGSVFLLKEPLQDLAAKLASGLGADRYAGYGAVIPHPMFASMLCNGKKSSNCGKVLQSSYSGDKKSPVYCGYELHKKCGARLSPSQISRLINCAKISLQTLTDFLETQRLSRPERIWEQWKTAKQYFDEQLKEYSQQEILEMLKVWHDLSVGERG